MSQSDPLDLLGSIWLHLEPSEVPISHTSTWSGTFFDTQYNKPALTYKLLKISTIICTLYSEIELLSDSGCVSERSVEDEAAYKDQ